MSLKCPMNEKGFLAKAVSCLDYFEKSNWWRGKDLNLRTPKRADLQSAAIDHSTTPPHDLFHRKRDFLLGQYDFSVNVF